ncbi:MAG TPA: SRPBCC family protein [Casimicrobiaceae bacterium]
MGRLARCAIYVGLLALVSVLPFAAAAAESPQSSDVDVTVRRDGEAIIIDVDLRVDASPQQAWEVLTDYNHMAAFVSSLTMSRVVTRSDGKLEVAQISQYALGPFHFKFDNVREVELVPPLEIRSLMIRGDMKASTFTTRLLPEGGGTRILNHGRMIPDRWIPPLIGTDMIKTATRKQFSELRAEIVRRSRRTALSPHFNSSGGFHVQLYRCNRHSRSPRQSRDVQAHVERVGQRAPQARRALLLRLDQR